jgi:hypothetical protein
MRFFKAFPKDLGLAIAIALAFLVMSFVRLAGDTLSAAFHNVVHDSVFAGSMWGTALARNLAVFVLTLVAVYLCLAVVTWALARASAFAFPRVKATGSHWVLIWSCLIIGTILIVNSALYPHSSLGQPYAKRVKLEWSGISAFAATIGILTLAVVLTLAAATRRWLRERRRLSRSVAVTLAGVALIATAAAIPACKTHDPPSARPHVIIIGIDSLRHDETQPGGPSYAPNVERFLAKSISFDDAITPLARTFPSWVSILTGRNPHTTGAIINLLPRRLFNPGETLGDLFRRAGYHTVYGIDEVRFSNIDTSYGFDEAITPPIGASDFLIGWFGDTPLSNLLVNTRIGATLFPYLHANRGAAKLYDPDQYLQRLERELRFSQPTFAAVHLTLAHWPFYWRDSGRALKAVDRRRESVTRVDQQFGDLMAMLERRGALAYALVIVLSDHGESLGSLDDTLVRDTQELGELYDEHKSPRGHGTDVLSPQQYQVVLGMRCYGKCPIEASPPRRIDSPVSLEDLAPTLNDLFALGAKDSFDGRSLRPLLYSESGHEALFRGRVRFTESEFNPLGLLRSSGEVSASGMAAAALFYTIEPKSDRIEIRKQRLVDLLEQRQYAAFDQDTLLAALPHSLTQNRLIAVRRDRSEARKLTAIPSATQYPDLVPLYRALATRYGFFLEAPPIGDAK